jgi:hypothetical protein
MKCNKLVCKCKKRARLVEVVFYRGARDIYPSGSFIGCIPHAMEWLQKIEDEQGQKNIREIKAKEGLP